MDSEQHNEWAALRAAAGEALRAGEWSLRLGMHPSFDEAWTVGLMPVVRRSPDRLREPGFDVCSRIWRCHLDSRKLESPVERMKHPRPLPPTIETLVAPIDRQQALDLITSLDQFAVPALPRDRPHGLDGVRFELTAGNPFCGSEFHWWSHAPGAWLPLANWWKAAWTTLLDALALPHDKRPRID